jgi:hypothetical protein
MQVICVQRWRRWGSRIEEGRRKGRDVTLEVDKKEASRESDADVKEEH